MGRIFGGRMYDEFDIYSIPTNDRVVCLGSPTAETSA